VEVEKVDFISIPSEDKERAKEFYCGVLGLELEKPTDIGYEFAAGNVTIGIWEPEAAEGCARVPGHERTVRTDPDQVARRAPR
jgi:catechol 2,3-dioxygenase-like lactoylglutathione lyase family enzyme